MIKLHSTTYANALLDALRQAEKNIYAEIYIIKGKIGTASDEIDTLINILKLKISAGVDIRILIDSPSRLYHHRQSNRFFCHKFYSMKIPFACGSGITPVHGKVFSIDKNKIFIGSHNLTRTSLFNPHEYSVYTDDEEIIKWFDEDFLLKWTSPEYKTYPPNEWS
jgi:phosphatidylserine/phosphatidylglycerophosphate/cardiolipin synthase-like enzyme